jgi:taurine dioxygenase
MVGVRKLGPTLGAEVSGIDVESGVDHDTVEAIKAALAEHQVLFFRDQYITDEQFRAFGQHFSDLNVHESLPNLGGDLETTQVLDSAGSLARMRGRSIPWHADSTFLEEPPMGALLRAVQLPTVGGDTLFASMYAAHDRLSPAMQEFLAGLTAAHYFRDRSEDRAIHPVVTVHPVTRRRVLFVNDQHTSRIIELAPSESETVLHFLYDHVNNPDFQIRWTWRVGDIAFWDNRAVQHYAVGDYSERRLMHRLSLRGDRPAGPTFKAVAVGAEAT